MKGNCQMQDLNDRKKNKIKKKQAYTMTNPFLSSFFYYKI